MKRTDGTARIASTHLVARRVLLLLVLTVVAACSSPTVSRETVGRVQQASGTGPPDTHVQSKSNIAGGVTSLTAPFSAAVNAGDLLVAMVRAGSAASGTTVSDNINGNWTALSTSQNGSEGVWYFPNSAAAAAGALTVNAQNSTSNTIRIIIDEFAGGNNWSVVTSTNGAPSLAAGTAGAILTSATSSIPANYLVYGGGTTATNSVTWTAGATNGVTMALGGTLSNASLGSGFSEYALVSASGTQNPTIKASVATSPSCGVVIFKAELGFSPTSSNAILTHPMASVTVSGGSGVYTGGSASCVVSLHPSNPGGSPTCSISGSTVSYTPTGTAATDTITVTDSQGTSGTFNVTVENPVVFSPTSSNAVLTHPMASVTVSGGSGVYTGGSASCVVSLHPSNPGGSPTCSISGSTVNYTPSGTAATDTITVTDSQGTSGTFNVTVENPISFSPTSSAAPNLGAMNAVIVSGGSGVYTSGSASCVVSSHPSNPGGSPTCSISGSTVSYTAGGTAATDTITVTDSQGHSNSFNVVVETALAFTPTSSNAIASQPMAAVTISGGSSVYTGGSSGCAVTAHPSNPGGSPTCSISGNTVSYTAGATAGTTDTITITDSHGLTGTFNVTVENTVTCTASYALAMNPAVSVTASGGSGIFPSCAITTNTSGGSSCAVGGGGAVTYTAGPTAGYNILSEQSGNYLGLSTTTVQTGGTVGSTAQLWKMAMSGAGFTFQSAGNASPAGTGNYMRSNGTNIVADQPIGSAGVFSEQDCNGTAFPSLHNRFGYSSAASKYWQAPTGSPPNVIVQSTACNPNVTGRWEAFYLVPGGDVLTVTDSNGRAGTCAITVENPVALQPSSISVASSSSIPAQSGGVNAVQAWGGSGIFPSGSAGCTVVTNNSHSGGTCSVTASGSVSYTTGATAGTDTLKISDSQGNSANLTVLGQFVVSATTSYALASHALASPVTVSGGSGNFTCSIATNTSGGSSCSVGANGAVTYTAGPTAGYNIESEGSSTYLQLSGTAVESGGAAGSSAQLWKLTSTGSAFTIQSAGNASPAGTFNYMRVNGSSDVVADEPVAYAGTFPRQDCNGTAFPTVYNRFGFGEGGSYWSVGGSPQPLGAGTTLCNPNLTGRWEAFYLNPGTDTLTVSDTAGHSGTITVTVENPVGVVPNPASGTASTPLSGVQAWGGSGLFTGGSSGCSVTTNVSGGGACTLSGSGVVSYTPSSTAAGTDVLTIKDSQGNAGTVSVNVGLTAISFGVANPVQQLAPQATEHFIVNGGGSLTWSIANNNSHGTINSSTGVYTAGTTGNVSDVVSVTNGTSTATVVVSVGPPVTIMPPSPIYLKPSGTITLTASGGSGSFSGSAWSFVTNVTGASVGAGTGSFSAGSGSGTDVVRVTDTLGNTATVTIVVGCGADAKLQILYPYNKTVFPLAIPPPLIQWADNGTAYYAKVTLQYPSTGTPIFTWSEIVPENGPLASPYNLLPTALPVNGGGRAQIPSLVWKTFQNAAAGSDAHISVQTLESNQGTLPQSITIHFAPAQLKGTIYYQSYDTNLVSIAPPSGAILSFAVGSSTPTVVDGSTACRVCHTVSSQGNVLLDNEGDTSAYMYEAEATVALPSGTETVAPDNNDGRFTWPGISPDGTLLFTTAGSAGTGSMFGEWGNTNAFAYTSGLYSVSTGAAVPTSGIPPGLQVRWPTFATDTSAVAFNYDSYDGLSLAQMAMTPNTPSAGTWGFSPPTVLFTPPALVGSYGYTTAGGMACFPSYMPAGQNGLVVEDWLHTACGSEPCQTAGSNINNSDFTHNIGPPAELWWVSQGTTPVPARLDNANGVGYLPQGYNGHGLAGTTVGPTANGCTPSPTNVCPNPSDQGGGFPSMAQLMTLTTATCMEDLLTALGNGNDARENFLPSVNPQITGGYQWMIFMSRRMYGNVATINPYGSDQRHVSEIVSTANPRYVDPKKLWVAAMNPNPTPGTDPSYPAFYLEGQELYAGNSRGYWVLPQCVASSATLSGANLCTSTQDCCQTPAATCALDIPVTSNPPTRHCIPNTSNTCKADGAACNVDGDCCNLASEGTRCASGICTEPPHGQYSPAETVTYDFQGCAPSGSTGTSTIWAYINSDQVVPAGTSITISAQTAATEAALATATPIGSYTLTTTTAAPSYVSGPFTAAMPPVSETVDQALRALSPVQASLLWLRVNVTLKASSDLLTAPTLTSLLPTFDCAPTE